MKRKKIRVERCVCGHSEEDHYESFNVIRTSINGGCNECNDCIGYKKQEEDNEKKIEIELKKVRSQMSNLLIPDECFDELERREEELMQKQEDDNGENK